MDQNNFRIACLASLATMFAIIRKRQQTEKKVRKRNRKIWVKEIYLKRKQQGFYDNLISEMRNNDIELFFNFTRMTTISFDCLLSLCGPSLKKHSPREAIQPCVRLMVTLRFLATGDSYSSLAYAFRIHKSTICNIIRETCDIIWKILSPVYLKFNIPEEWSKIASEFYGFWQLPNCVGAIDGKHVRIRAPSNSRSQYSNYKKYFSIILLAVSYAKYNFTYVDVGAYGAQSDGGVLKNSVFEQQLLSGNLNIPKSNPLPGTHEPVPLYFIGDEAFPLHINLFRPYSRRRGARVPEEELVFNYRLSRARRLIENTLGIMVARFRIFHREINAEPETVDAIIKACTCLHNFIRSQKQDIYCNNNFIDREIHGELIQGEWRNEVTTGTALQNPPLRFGNRNATQDTRHFRDLMKQYLNGPVGSNMCPWQFEHVRRTI